MRKAKRVWLMRVALACIVCGISNTSQARGQYLDWFKDYYKGLESAQANCQLCHERSSGGNGWNRYGWAIRPSSGQQLANAEALISRLNIVADELSSNAQGALQFIDEIRYNSQPGWTAGATNTITFADGSTQIEQSPNLNDD